IVQVRHLLLGVVDEVGRQHPPVELNALDYLELGLEAFAVLHRDHAFFSDFVIASEMILPISMSALAEMAPTCAISLLVVQALEIFFSSSTTAMTDLSIPRFRSIGFMPEATNFIPSFTIDCARTVAVVVPSPATSDVLEATSFTICAPMFSNLSFSSISLATETPSLVIVGAP